MKSFLSILSATALLAISSSAFAGDYALGGYCPVCYIAVNKAAKGTTDFKSEHNGKTYLFVSQSALDTFKTNPDKYLPQYNSYCAYGMSLGKKFPSDPTVFTVKDGRVFLNKDAEIGKLFQKDTAAHIAKADTHWTAMKKEMMMKKGSDSKKEMMDKGSAKKEEMMDKGSAKKEEMMKKGSTKK